MQIKDLSKKLGITNKELITFFNENEFEVANHMSAVTDEMLNLAQSNFTISMPEPKPIPKTFGQTDPILCRSVTPGWLGMSGKSGQYYVFTNIGDEQEVEYQDLFALKNSRSRYLYDPLIIIDDEELLENPRWKDIKEFYADQIYGMDNINEILNAPVNSFKNTLTGLPKGLKKALIVEVAQRIENGTFDSLKKINIIDDVCGTDFKHILAIN